MESEDRKPIFTKKLILGILAAILLISIIFLLLRNCEGDDYKVQQILLSPTSIGIGVAQKQQILANILPTDAKNKLLLWSSSNVNIATVDKNGLVTGVAEGVITITASASDGSGVVGKTTVTVGNQLPKLEQLQLNKGNYTITLGKTTVAIVTPIPSTAEIGEITYKIADTKIATVDMSGKIKAVKVGKTVLTVTASNGNISTTTSITVNEAEVPVTKVQFPSDNCYKLKVGKSYQLNPVILPTNSTNKTLTWSSSDVSLATVDEKGKVTAIKASETENITITAKSKNGVYGTFLIKTISSGIEGSCSYTCSGYTSVVNKKVRSCEPTGSVGVGTSYITCSAGEKRYYYDGTFDCQNTTSGESQKRTWISAANWTTTAGAQGGCGGKCISMCGEVNMDCNDKECKIYNHIYYDKTTYTRTCG